MAESAAIAVPDDVTGQAVNAFVSVKDDSGGELDGLQKEFILQVRKCIGPFAAPKQIYVVPDLPKTRSGKIMRRVLRKILLGEVHADQLGDMSTMSFPCIFFKSRRDQGTNEGIPSSLILLRWM